MRHVPLQDRNLVDIIENSGVFDPQWYSGRYSDVAHSEVEPALHFARYGQWLDRRPSESCSDEQLAALRRAVNRRKTISYCIPIMNRLDDLVLTLAANLDENRRFSESIEFVVSVYDRGDETLDWIRAEFAADLQSGYLRAIRQPPLEFWHFGKAKNGFVGRIMGQVYSSLDGDNFVTADETRQLAKVIRETGGRFLLHHFSGSWGDGTSGRISVPRDVYEHVRYDERFFPRQFDEIDLVLSAFTAYPDLQFCRYDTHVHAFASSRMSEFMSAKPRLPPKTKVLAHVARKLPINPKGQGYVTESPVLYVMQEFNQLASFFKNSNKKEKQKYLRGVVSARHKVIDAMPHELLEPQIVSRTHELAFETSDKVCVFACVKNSDAMLESFYRHYKSIGAAAFFVVDDGSDTPVRNVLPYDDVFVFTPRAGTFVTAKGMWLEALMKKFLAPGTWALAVDADEFLDLPPGVSSLQELCRVAEAGGKSFIPALLVDMAPGGAPETFIGAPVAELLSACDSFCVADAPVKGEYARHSSIAWGFGEYSALSWSFDARYHAFGTFDSLRKVSLFRYGAGLHLNQGFHDLHFTDRQPPLGNKIWNTDIVLAIRHYKLAQIFDAGAHRNFGMTPSQIKSAYHERTAENIIKVFGAQQEETVRKLGRLERNKYSTRAFAERVGAVLKPLGVDYGAQKTDGRAVEPTNG